MIRSIHRQIIVLICIAAVGGCVHQKPVTLARGESLAVFSDGQAGKLNATVDDTVKKAGQGAALGIAGAVGGVAVGGLAGAVFGLACGPAAIICVPLAAAAGAGTGGVMGGTAGAVYGGTGGIPVAKAREFNALSTQLLQQEMVLADLESTFARRAGRNWQVRQDSEHQVILRLVSLDFEQPGKQMVRVRVKAEMDTAVNGRKRTISVERANPPVHIDRWLDDGTFLTAELNTVIHSTARALVTALAVGV